jgi:hypothetical protein
MTRRQIEVRLASGLWERVQPGVYRVAGTPSSWHQDLLAACLTAGPTALVSHRAGAAFWGFEGIRARSIEISSPRWLRRPRGEIVLHETQDLADGDYTRLQGIPVTSPLRVLVDIGCLVPPAQLESMAVEGMRRRWFTFEQLKTRHREIARRGRNGAGPLRALLREWDQHERLAHSGWEVRLSRLLVSMGFPRPTRQIRVVDDQGNFVAQVDMGYPALKVAIEGDSETWHTGLPRFHSDRTRRNLVTAAGWEFLTYTYEHYRHDHGHIRSTLDHAIQRQTKALTSGIA